MKDPRDTPELTGAFTVIFPGDIRKFAANPMDAETPFGKPQAVGMGDAFAEVDRLESALREIGEKVQFAEYESREWDIAKIVDAALK